MAQTSLYSFPGFLDLSQGCLLSFSLPLPSLPSSLPLFWPPTFPSEKSPPAESQPGLGQSSFSYLVLELEGDYLAFLHLSFLSCNNNNTCFLGLLQGVNEIKHLAQRRHAGISAISFSASSAWAHTLYTEIHTCAHTGSILVKSLRLCFQNTTTSFLKNPVNQLLSLIHKGKHLNTQPYSSIGVKFSISIFILATT